MSIAETTIVVDGKEIAGEALLENARRAASGFLSMGVTAGDTVALLLRNDLAFLEASFGTALAGALPVPVNWHASRAEIAHVIADSGAKILVAHADLVEAAGTTVSTLEVAVSDSLRAAHGLDDRYGVVGDGAPDWRRWMDEQVPLDAAGLVMPSTVVYTSGTTGLPKGVRREPRASSDRDAERAGAAAVQALGVAAGMRTAITAPLCHSAPNAYALQAARIGAKILLPPRFDPEGLLELVEKHRLTRLQLVPTMCVRLLGLTDEVRRRYDLSSLEHVVHAGAPCPPSVKRAMIAWMGPIVHEYYGSTETSILTSTTTAEWLERPGTVGRPLPTVRLRILDDAGAPVPAGEVGEVAARVEGMPDFTYQNRDLERDALDRDGLIATGDLGFLDADGYLFLRDRKKDLVVSGGVNIYPAEIEAVIASMPEVGDVAVFGIPDEQYGEVIAAAVSTRSGSALTGEAVREYVAASLPGLKVPRLVEFHDELPQTASGKILKRVLRQPHWAGTGRSI